MHWLGWFMGISPVPDGTSVMYQLWSGFIPALAVISLVAGAWGHFKRLNCHVHRCWRIGRYDAGPYKVCHKHHPRDDVTKKVTAENVSSAYKEAA